MLNLVDDLDNLLQRSTRLPGSGKLLVEEASLRQIIEQMRESLPDEVQLGQRIAAERERILADARIQARRIQEEAQTQVNARLEDHAIVQAARQRARDIQAEAEQRAASLRAEANAYVSGQLSALEARLQRLIREVQAGQRTLVQDPAKRADSGGQS
jgi:hypothetical protein